ncbi:yqaJ domain-containing protein [Nephila pilipes]|uniref:YqaJ domain-containing protein n=1 Tax=Nephila pilipes TaxID=299642 RepID=A0A8X6TRH6_NEPPI|nr:yqaJ domain-containing protein [Nephila pilipes]
MPLKNIPNKNRSRKHPGFNQASKAQRLRRKEEKRNRLEMRSPNCLRTPENDLTADDYSSMSDLPDLCIDTPNNNSENCLPVGNFLCNLSHVITQVRKLELHSYTCNFGGNFVFKRMNRSGHYTELHYACSDILCNEQIVITSDSEKNSLNNLSVLGALSTGSGFSQEEEKFSVMNIRYMSKDKFASCEKVTSKVIKSYAQEEMLNAIFEEKKLAELRGDIDSDGYHCITLIVDGGWCKRSYGHGYNASSGVSVLIGMSTQKIVFIGIRNKVCLTCSAIANRQMERKDHVCWKNWSGPSTAMESDAVVEGLIYLENVHHIRCTRLVGDGDANTIAKCKERVSYGGRILKVECANHAVRRYGRAIQKLQGNTSRFSGQTGIKARKLLKQKIMKLIIGARNVIKVNAINHHNQPEKEKIKNLISDFRNVPNHVFGKHDNCGDFCKRKSIENNETEYSIMHSSGLLHAIQYEIGRTLVACSNTLIWNATNNPAETYMSQLCKISGGKRINFSKAGGFNRRANIAVLAFQNPAQQYHGKAYKMIANKSPSTPLNKFLLTRRNKYLKRLQRKKLFPNIKKFRPKQNTGDCNYGDSVEKPDMPTEIFESMTENLLLKLKVQNNSDVEFETRGQTTSERWRYERSLRLSSSFFKEVACRKALLMRR